MIGIAIEAREITVDRAAQDAKAIIVEIGFKARVETGNDRNSRRPRISFALAGRGYPAPTNGQYRDRSSPYLRALHG